MSATRKSYDVVIVGGGPAGTSAAIHLATRGAHVLLAEKKKFPRAKLCGEFISPECLEHFERLGVADRLMGAGGVRLVETVFYARGGSSINVPSEWFGTRGQYALGLSRAEMDMGLLTCARDANVDVLEEAQSAGLIIRDGRVRGVCLKVKEAMRTYDSLVAIDATGRTRSLARYLAKKGSSAHGKNRRATLVAFKAHLEDACVAEGHCEIYFYPGGYGGLSRVEGGLSNLCFICAARDVCACGSDAERVVREVVMRNRRAQLTLAGARVRTHWLSVALDSFGRREIVPAAGLLAVGDAASFIDPFTGSGMLMALESGELAAGVILRRLAPLRAGASFESLAADYRARYHEKFSTRLRVCALMRRAAFVPGLAEVAIALFGTSDYVRRRVARATHRASLLPSGGKAKF